MRQNYFKRLRKVLQTVSKDYYDCSETISDTFKPHLGFQKLQQYAAEAQEILECGCGIGSSLKLIWRKKAYFYGIDITSYAVKRARKLWQKRPNVTFRVGLCEKLSFVNQRFDLVYSSYTLEHVLDPDKAVSEMIRVVKPNGLIVIICPNYGSPLEYSAGFPKAWNKLLLRAIGNCVNSFVYLLFPPDKLLWRRVNPPILKTGKYFPDSDVTWEPYIQTLLTYLERKRIEILEFSSGFGWEVGSRQSLNKLPFKYDLTYRIRNLCRWFAKIGLVPFIYYGPTVFVVGRKV